MCVCSPHVHLIHSGLLLLLETARGLVKLQVHTALTHTALVLPALSLQARALVRTLWF